MKISIFVIYYASQWEAWRLVNGILLTNEMLFGSSPKFVQNFMSMFRMTILLVFILIFLRRFSTPKAKNVPTNYWILPTVISIAGIGCLSLFDITYSLSGYPNFSSYIAAVFIAINLLSYYMFNIITMEYSKNADLRVMYQRSIDDVSALEKNKLFYQNLRRLKHELKNHISFMKALLEDKKYEDLSEYFTQLESENFALLKTIDCGNKVLNNILNNEMEIARNKGINFDTFVSVPPELNILDNDLCSLLFNLLDNAFEAAAASKVPVVSLTMNMSKDFLFIKVKNSIASSVLAENPELKTTKKNAHEHGIGISVIKSIVSSYNGQVLFEEQDNMFVSSAMLLVPETK